MNTWGVYWMKTIYLIIILLFVIMCGSLSASELVSESDNIENIQTAATFHFVSPQSSITLLADKESDMGSAENELIRDTITWFAISVVPFGASAALYTTLIGLTLAPYAPYLGYSTIVFSSLEIISFVLGSIFGTITLAVGVGFIIMGVLSAQKLYQYNKISRYHDDTVPTMAMGFLL